MSERQIELVRATIYLTIAVVYLAVIVSMAFPEFGQHSRRGLQWVRYYHWLATRVPVPGWMSALQRDDLPDELVPS